MGGAVPPAALRTGGSLAEEVMVRTCRGWGGVTEGTTAVERDAEVGEPACCVRFGWGNRMSSYHPSPSDGAELMARSRTAKATRNCGARHVDAWEGFPFGVSEGSAGQVEASIDDVHWDRVARCE